MGLETDVAKDFETRSITLLSRDHWHHVNSVVSHQLAQDSKRKPEHQMTTTERVALSDFIQAYADFCMGNPTSTIKPFNPHADFGHVQGENLAGNSTTDGLTAATDAEAAASIK